MPKNKLKILSLFLILFINLFFALGHCAPSNNYYCDFWQKSEVINYFSKIFNYFKSCFTDNPEITAYHESGHALVAALLDLKISKMTIIPTSECVGHVKFTPKTELDKIKVYIAGYAAEEIIYGKTVYGAYEDKDKAIQIASELSKSKFSSQKNPEAILEQCLLETKKMIIENIDALHALAKAILEKQTLNGKEVYQMIANNSTCCSKEPDFHAS